MNDKSAGIYGSFFSLGAVIGPIVGGALYDLVGFQSANDIMLAYCIFCFIIYTFFNGMASLAEKNNSKNVLDHKMFMKRSS